MEEVGFAIKQIVTGQFATFNENLPEKGSVDFESGIRFQVNPIRQVIIAHASAKFSHKSKVFLILELGVYFQIEQEAWNNFTRIEEDKIIFPKGFLAHLGMIAVGTLRGALHAKTENTPFNKYLLPTINVAERVKTDGVFSMNEIS